MHQTDPTQGELSFDLLAEIAVGATARVELCRVADGPLSDELVAVKRLHPHIADDPQFLDMFRDEVWMTAALKHENVVEVKGWGHDGHGPWLAVEFVRGVSLQRLMKTVFETGEMFTERMVVYLARCVCDGLAAAHDLRGSSGEALHLVHRDMTPGNILLGFEGQVKITDFGLAKAKQRLTKTLTGLLKGQPQYMSPEQVSGRALDGRSDIFAFGVVLFELFSGRRPWNANTDLDVMRAITDEPPGDLLAFRPRIDRALGDIVAKCLEKNPADRWQSAAALRDRFDEWLEVHGYRSDNDVSLARFVRRNAMRQMRWFERAVGGEFAEEAKAKQPPPPPGAPTSDEVSHSDAIDAPEPVDWGDDGPTLVQPSEPVQREAAAFLEAKKDNPDEQDTQKQKAKRGDVVGSRLGRKLELGNAKLGKPPSGPRAKGEAPKAEDSSPSRSTPRAKASPRGSLDPAEAETPRATPPKRTSKAKPPPLGRVRQADPRGTKPKAVPPPKVARRPRAETITEAHPDSLPVIGSDDDDLETERRNPWSHLSPKKRDDSDLDLGEVGMRMRDLFKEERQTDDTLGVVAPPDPDVPPVPGHRLPTRPGPPPTPHPGPPSSGQRPVPRVGEDADAHEPVTRPDAPHSVRRLDPDATVDVNDTAATRQLTKNEAEHKLAIADPPSDTAPFPTDSVPAHVSPGAGVDIVGQAERLGKAAQAAANAATHAAELADARARAAELAGEAALLSATGQRHAAMQKLRQAMRIDEAIEMGQPPPRERPYALDAVLATELDPGRDPDLDFMLARRPPAPSNILDRNTVLLIVVVVVIFGMLMAVFILA